MKKLIKFFGYLAVIAGIFAAVYYFLTKDESECLNSDEDSEEFFEKKRLSREYVSLNTNETASAVKDAKETIMQKLDEAAMELKEKAQNIAEGVGLIKDKDPDTEEFEFEEFTTEEDSEEADASDDKQE